MQKKEGVPDGKKRQSRRLLSRSEHFCALEVLESWKKETVTPQKKKQKSRKERVTGKASRKRSKELDRRETEKYS